MNTCAFSPCRKYRYTLVHKIGGGVGRIAWIGLNPSTADEQTLDPTLRRVRGFSKLWGFDEFVMLNLFAFRSTDPLALMREVDPVGPENNAHLLAETMTATAVVAAWGVNGVVNNQDRKVMTLLKDEVLLCLGQTKHGHPKHPLYVAGTAKPVAFNRPHYA